MYILKKEQRTCPFGMATLLSFVLGLKPYCFITSMSTNTMHVELKNYVMQCITNRVGILWYVTLHIILITLINFG